MTTNILQTAKEMTNPRMQSFLSEYVKFSSKDGTYGILHDIMFNIEHNMAWEYAYIDSPLHGLISIVDDENCNDTYLDCNYFLIFNGEKVAHGSPLFIVMNVYDLIEHYNPNMTIEQYGEYLKRWNDKNE